MSTNGGAGGREGSARLFTHHMMDLFDEFDEDVQRVVGEVLWLEQEHISMKNPRGVKEKIREFIDQKVKD